MDQHDQATRLKFIAYGGPSLLQHKDIWKVNEGGGLQISNAAAVQEATPVKLLIQYHLRYQVQTC